MSSILYTDLILPAGVTATSAQAGYAALNLTSFAVAKEWRANNAAQTDIVIDLGADQAQACVMLQGPNFSAASVFTAANATPTTWTARGSFSSAISSMGYRRRGYIVRSDTDRYVKFTIAAGAPSDGRPYWACGAVYVMRTALTLPAQLQFGVNSTPIEPGARDAMFNGKKNTVFSGDPFDSVQVNFRRFYQNDMSAFMQKTMSGVTVFWINNSQYPEMVWPVRRFDPAKEVYDKLGASMQTVTLEEVVA